MAEFLTGTDITSSIVRMFRESNEWILIVSPFIKLSPHVKESLEDLADKPHCKLSIVFGKNEDDLTKSINEHDFEFFRNLPNVEIKHQPRLHAKYYASEQEAVLSSMNLYDFSHNNNIEFGIKTKISDWKRLGKSMGLNGDIDHDAEIYFKKVEQRARQVFLKEPEFKKGLVGFKKTYVDSHILKDELSGMFRKEPHVAPRNTGSPSGTVAPSANTAPSGPPMGFCIRTGEPIPFDLSRPLSYNAFQVWSRFSDEYYEENYCHFSGEQSFGETCYARPVLRKYWREASALQDRLWSQQT